MSDDESANIEEVLINLNLYSLKKLLKRKKKN